ncbi:hypothetical protein RXV95_03230 [Novosphingobium sp. ZN18A2]|uniref:hypothetical protein n=1 Tax=Novosphingobium sp. ZN18A2 TaxID=3079861 RepID=UPI0030CB5079
MLNGFVQHQPRVQQPLADAPYDRWIAPGGDCAALFHRRDYGYLLRFPGQADFEIDIAGSEIRAFPASPAKRGETETLFHNAVVPVVGNHLGALNLHGSAVRIGGRAVAFMGVSRRGKTTLAAGFAKAGFPFLTEDVLSLDQREDGYHVRPGRPVLRLFRDSAAFLRDEASDRGNQRRKQEMAASGCLPFSDRDARLAGIFLLGPGTATRVTLRKLAPAEAMVQLMQHAFILDVEDRKRLRRHFDRIASLSEAVQCHTLDYPRRYDLLPSITATVIQCLGEEKP